MKFNINHCVKVKLTDVGIAELKRQHDHIYAMLRQEKEFVPPEVDENGMSTFQLWDLMYKLGHMCSMGGKSPFKSNIEIPTDESV